MPCRGGDPVGAAQVSLKRLHLLTPCDAASVSLFEQDADRAENLAEVFDGALKEPENPKVEWAAHSFAASLHAAVDQPDEIRHDLMERDGATHFTGDRKWQLVFDFPLRVNDDLVAKKHAFHFQRASEGKTGGDWVLPIWRTELPVE